MKTNHFLPIFCLLLCTTWAASAQTTDYQPLLQQSSWKCEMASCGVWWGEFITTNGETILDGVAYTALSYTDSLWQPMPWASDMLLLREDLVERKVWAYSPYDSTEYLLYDFGMAIGDTIAPSVWQTFVLTDMDEVNTSGGVRRRFMLQSLEDTQTLTWIEGIGNQYHPFDSFRSYGSHTVCKWDYDKLIVGSDCGEQAPDHVADAMATVSPTIAQHAQAMPNPTQERFLLQIAPDMPLPQRVLLFDLSGKRLQELVLPAQHSVEIDLSQLPTATYIYRIEFSPTYSESGKIIKMGK